MSLWEVERHGRVKVYSVERLRRKLACGKLSVDARARPLGGDAWRPLREMAELGSPAATPAGGPPDEPSRWGMIQGMLWHGVVYGSVVGIAARRRDVNPLLLPTYLWLGDRGGASDGVVPAESQRWGEVVATIEADHWAQIGWSRRFDAAEFYVELLRDLRGRGL